MFSKIVGMLKKNDEETNIETLKKEKKKHLGSRKEKKNLSIDEDTESVNQNVTTIKDIIASSYCDFAEDPRYMNIGEGKAKNMYIGVLPSMVSFPTYLDELYNFGDIDTSLFICPIDNEDAITELSKLRTNLETELITAEGSNRRDDMGAKTYEAKRLRSEVRDGFNKIYDVATLTTLYAHNQRELDTQCTKLRQIMARKDTRLTNAIRQQEEAFLSNKPLMNNMINDYHTFDKRALACTFPFTSSNINHRNGVPIGRNMDNYQPIIFDNFDRSLKNYNMVIFAQSGGGKSTFLKMLAARGSTFDDIINVAIDIEPEYNDIAEILGGTSIKIAQGTENIINFFDVTTEKVENKLNGKSIEVVNLESKENSVTSILLTMAKGFTGYNQKYYNDITRSLIKRAVKQVYADFGITNDVSSLYTYTDSTLSEDGKIIGGLQMKEMPTISDWYKVIERNAKENKNETYTQYYDYLLMVMSEFCNYTNGGFTCFDGQSTVELSYDCPFTNFDVSALNEDTELPLAQHIICDYIWESLVKKNDKGYKIRVIVDEAWRMAKVINNVPKFEEALAFLEKLFRRARKKNTSAVIISQQFNEFYNDQTQSIIRNADTRVFLPPDNTSIDDIEKVFHLTKGEIDYLKSTQTGEALFKCGTQAAKLQVEIPDFELEFVETNQNAKQRVG